MELTHRTIQCRPKRTFRISSSASDSFTMVICVVRHGDVVGYGEAAPSERVTGETPQTVRAFLDRAGKDIEPLAPADAEAYLTKLHAEAALSRENARPSARAAVDLAIHDLLGKFRGVPARTLHALPAGRLETSMTVSLDTPAAMADEARGYHDRGFRVIKLKVGDARDDVARVEAVRAACPHSALRVDANTGWSTDDARVILPRLADLGVEFVEQPFPPAADAEFVALSHETPVPLFADESVLDTHDVRRLLAMGFRGGVNLKLQKLGGIAPAVAAIATAREAGLAVQMGCNVETAVGISAGLQLLGVLDHADLDGHLLLRDEPFHGARPIDGWYTTPEAPGLGVTPA